MSSGTSSNYISVSQSTRVGMNGAVKSFFGHHTPSSITHSHSISHSHSSHKRRHSLLHDSKYGHSSNQSPLPSNFHPPESFVNLLYRMIEEFTKKNRNNKKSSSNSSSHTKFALAILDIDNLRGHIQSPVLSHEEFKEKMEQNMINYQMKQMEQKAKENDNEQFCYYLYL